MSKQNSHPIFNRLFLFLRQPVLVPICILAIGLFLRGYHWGSYRFGFDQVQILTHAQEIKNGDLTLIGPQTGPAQMFTGPLIYYLTAALLFVIPSPWTLVGTSVLLAFLTGSTLYWLSHRALGRQPAVVTTALWSASPLLINLDRIPWNPNLTVLAATLVFFPVYSLVVKDTTKWRSDWSELAFIFLGCFLGYQAHFSGFFLPGLVVCSLLLRPKRAPVIVVVAGAGLLASLIPTVLFDLKNNWYNTQGLLQLTQHSAPTLLIDRVKSFANTTGVMLKNTGWVTFWDTNNILPIVSGSVITIWAVFQAKKQKFNRAITVPLVWLLAIAVAFSFYEAAKPEYYFLLQIPASLLLLQQTIFTWLKNQRWQYYILVGLLIYSTLYTINTFRTNNGMNIANQVAVRQYVTGLALQVPVKDLIYDMEPVHAVGLRYLLRDIPLNEQGRDIHLNYPYIPRTLANFSIHDLSVLHDPRSNPELQYVTEPRYIIGSPMNVSLYRTSYPADQKLDAPHYIIAQNNQVIGTLQVISRNVHEALFMYYTREVLTSIEQDHQWTRVTNPTFDGWALRTDQQVYLIPEATTLPSAMDSFLATFVIYD